MNRGETSDRESVVTEISRSVERSDAATLYLDLMKRCLTNDLYGDRECRSISVNGIRASLLRWILKDEWQVVRAQPFDPEQRRNGRDWPPNAETMIGLKRLDNLQACICDVLNAGVPGDFIETGVWRGGATIFMAACLRAFGCFDRDVWVADSFEGLPPPDPERYPEDAGDRHHVYEPLRVSMDDVKSNFVRYGLLDTNIKFLKGWFRDTLHSAPIDRLAIMRLDGDMYESTMDALNALYPRLSIGGYVIVDDYGAVEGCRRAVEDYRRQWGIVDEIHRIDWTGAFWQRRVD